MPQQVKDRDALQTYSDAISRKLPVPPDLEGNPGNAPHPPQFLPYPDVRGGPEFAKMVDLLLKRVPQLKEHVKRVVHGPDASIIEEMIYNGLSPNDYEHTDTLGTTSFPGLDNVTLNPAIETRPQIFGKDKKQVKIDAPPWMRDRMLSTLSHEFAHTAGHDEAGAQAAAAMMDKALGLRETNATVIKALPRNLLEELLSNRVKKIEHKEQ